MSWYVLNNQWDVTAFLNYSWRILAPVTKTLAYSWTIFQNVLQTLAYSWKIGGYVQRVLTYSWSISNQALAVLSYSWQILNAVVSSKVSVLIRPVGRNRFFSGRGTEDPTREVRRGRFWGTK
jgi:hypothetical protein